MKPVLVVFGIILIIGNIVGIFAIYKAYRYREALSTYQGYNQKLMENYQALQADYGGISVYASDNERLRKEYSPLERKKMTVLFGASITHGLDLERYFPGKNLINRGLGSQSDTQLLARFSSDVLRLDPGRVVVKFCSGNFTPDLDEETIWNEYETMAIMADNKGIKPLLATVIPATRRAERFENYSVANAVKKFNAKIREFAAEHNFSVVDYYRAMADTDGYMPNEMARDEIHPNEAGYKVMASVLSPLLD